MQFSVVSKLENTGEFVWRHIQDPMVYWDRNRVDLQSEKLLNGQKVKAKIIKVPST